MNEPVVLSGHFVLDVSEGSYLDVFLLITIYHSEHTKVIRSLSTFQLDFQLLKELCSLSVTFRRLTFNGL